MLKYCDCEKYNSLLHPLLRLEDVVANMFLDNNEVLDDNDDNSKCGTCTTMLIRGQFKHVVV